MRVKTIYLQMFARPERVVPPPREGLAVVHAKKPSVAYYRFLYDWTSRKKLSDAELAALLNDARLEVHVLMGDGVPAGFAELDRRVEGEIELVQFGLMPDFIGQGLGRYFLQWELPAQALLAPYLHQGPPSCPAELLEGGFRRVQAREDLAGVVPEEFQVSVGVKCCRPQCQGESRG